MKRQTTIHPRYLTLILSILFLCTCQTFVCFAKDEVYLAGAPNHWPFEYYDQAGKDYRGIIPDLLKIAGEQQDISIYYLAPSSEDHRLSLASNAQVDAICTVGLEENRLVEAGLEDQTELLSYTDNGRAIKISLAYTRSMPDTTRQALEQALQTIDSTQLQGLYVHYFRDSAPHRNRINNYRLTLSACFALFLLILFVLYRKTKKKNLQIRRLAYIDSTTGQDNLTSFQEKYNRCIIPENREHYAVLFLSAGIDNINHIYGYEEAHRALKLISETCAPFIHEEEEGFCRFHEFCFIYFIQYNDVESIKERVYQMQDAIKRAFEDAKKTYFLDIYTGIYRLRQIDDDMLRTIQYSEAALEYAQMYYLNLALYDEYVENAAISGYAMEHEAVHGLMHQEFIMYLQPIVNLNNGNIVAAEALVRWKNPKRGLLQPEDFLKTMRRKQLIGKMNMDIYRQGCRFLREETDKGHSFQMLFNFTAENMGDEQFVSHLNAVIEEYCLDAGQITIQLNQIVEIARVESFKETIKALRESGFNICLAGLELDRVFLEYLECGVNTLKLRRELIQQLEQPNGLKLMKSIITLCHDLGLRILCVGVENESQAKLLLELGCELASGFHYYYPLSQKTFTESFGETQH